MVISVVFGMGTLTCKVTVILFVSHGAMLFWSIIRFVNSGWTIPKGLDLPPSVKLTFAVSAGITAMATSLSLLSARIEIDGAIRAHEGFVTLKENE